MMTDFLRGDDVWTKLPIYNVRFMLFFNDGKNKKNRECGLMRHPQYVLIILSNLKVYMRTFPLKTHE